MTYSYATHASCPKCKTTYSIEEIQQLCSCGSPLLIKYDLHTLKKNWDRDKLGNRTNSLWRYHELLPIKEEKNIVTQGEGMTPLLHLEKLGERLDVSLLYMKDEGIIPTGSFKARGAAVGISKAKELGIQKLAMPTNGNAGAAWAMYASKAGIETTIVMPLDAPLVTRKESVLAGANVILVNGLISDAGKIVKNLVEEKGYYDASTLKEPYRIEGKKTMGLELLEQLNWHTPDVILYPTGGGVGLIGIYKALQELYELGWIEGSMPRLVAVQAEGCSPIVKAWKENKTESTFWEASKTNAFGINVPKAIGDFLVLEAIYESNGCAISVSEEEIQSLQKEVATIEGAFICPEGAATFAAAKKLREEGWIGGDEKVICLNTGLGIKYADLISEEPLTILEPSELLT
jgi:threonine synthase